MDVLAPVLCNHRSVIHCLQESLSDYFFVLHQHPIQGLSLYPQFNCLLLRDNLIRVLVLILSVFDGYDVKNRGQ